MSGTASGAGGKPKAGLEVNTKGVPVNWNGEHWDFYKALMISLFEEDDLENIATGKAKPPDPTATDTEKRDWKQNQATIKRLILGSVSLALAQRVMRNASGTEMWKTLEEMFEAPTNKTLFPHQQRQFMHQLRNTRAKRDDDMNLHLGKLYDIRDRLATMKYTVHDVDMVDAMLKSLPRHVKYQRLTEMVTSTPGSSYSVDDVRDLILVAASQLKEESYEFSGGRVENNGGRAGGGDGKTGKSGKQKHKYKQHQHQPDVPESKLKCYQCNQKGHIKKYCPELTGKKKASGADVSKPVARQDDHSSAVSRQSQREEQKVMSDSEAGSYSDVKDESKKVVEVARYNPRRWVYDTGASTHIVGANEYFVAYHEFEKPVVDIQGFAKGGQSPALGVGVAALATDIGDGSLTTIFLEEALFVPDANWNLYSVGLAMKQGFVERKNGRTGECKVYRNGTLVLRSKPAPNNVWDFEAHNAWIEDPPRQVVEYGEVANFTNADGVANIRTWHARLGHTCAQHLKQMVDKELVRGMLLKGRELPTCGTCESTKQKRKKRNKRFERGFDEPNETIFMDLMDPGKKNHTVYTHVLVIVDGYSRWMTVYMLTDKAAASGYFQQYVTWAEQQIGKPVKRVVSDTGGEFLSTATKAWCAEQGISLVPVAPDGSSVNHAERAIQTLRNTKKAMLSHSGLPQSFWPDALRNAVYIRNRVFCKGTKRTPFELFFGKKPDLHRIRTFGSLVYAHIPKHLRKKMANTSEAGFLLGYLEDCMGCKVYFPQYRVSRVVYTVKVHEDILYRDRHSIPRPVYHGWPDDQQDAVDGGDSEDDESASDQESLVEVDLESDSSSKNEETVEYSGNDEDSSTSRDEESEEDDVVDEDDDLRPAVGEPTLMHPRVFLRPMTDEDAEASGSEHDVGDEGRDEVESSKSSDDVQEDESVEGAGAGGEDGAVDESEHGDVSSAGDEPASENVEEKESVVPRDEHSYEDDANEEELRDYDDVAAEGDLPGAEQENVDDSPPQPMNVETVDELLGHPSPSDGDGDGAGPGAVCSRDPGTV